MEVKEKNNKKVSEKSKAVKTEIEDDAAVLDSAVFVVCAQDLRVFPVLLVEGNSLFPEDIRYLYKAEGRRMEEKEEQVGRKGSRIRGLKKKIGCAQTAQEMKICLSAL